ncbi:DoxX family protein [Paenibacillus melissococcoides]|uniref:DoxX family protein n=1 Tax=Paenibacillus melissococcoides TaxID=2912268 RepID=A0ABM9GCZ0_9BACL|nr:MULTISPECIES: DoxX family protein [Paenibacillus]MEB9895826.1 DoxX family protein [Bacillus cereus]CAH8249630.1 DoxX family protein [Paenibacillus melissococcoides]CAH8721424.1 DoxX family protein [Paenibacillus melissococcoides]CAH8721796.1 DoxX family protein [Paenibacillus melissococcoides]GIO80746.1 hypothetical protein J6TS7_43560 [Paenibacillus dendritiformis]
MTIVVIIIQCILIAMFTVSVLLKFGRPPSMVRHWQEYRYPSWFMDVTATLEAAGIAGLIAAFWLPAALKYAAVLYILLMLGAIHAHLFRAKHPPKMAINAAAMLLLSLILLAI